MLKICAYDELYLPLAQRVMGDMYDFAVNTLGIVLEEFQKMFLVSDISKQIEQGNPTYIAGKNGCEIARAVIRDCCGVEPEEDDAMYLDKSPEYWIGWSLAYYQWESGVPFGEIERVLPAVEMYALYATLHEADITQFVSVMDKRLEGEHAGERLRRLRSYAGITQKQLSQESGVPLRQIQLFEQGQRDLEKTQVTTWHRLMKIVAPGEG